MPAQHTLHVAFTQQLAWYVGEQVAIGHYATACEVVRAALRLPIERDAIGKRHGVQLEQSSVI